MGKAIQISTDNGIRKNIGKFYLSAFLGNLSFATGILIFHYRELGFSYLQIFIISVVYELLNFLLEIPTGVLADLWSCKKTITLGYFISGVSFFIVLINSEAFPIYIIWSMLSAICTTLNSGSVTAFIFDTMQEINPQKYPVVLGRISAISMITQAVSVVAGGLISELIGFDTALLLSGIGGLLQSLVIATTTEPKKTETFINDINGISQQIQEKVVSSFKILLNNQEVRFILLYGILVFILSQFVLVIYQPYFAELGYETKSQIGLISAGSLILMAVSSILIGKVKFQKTEWPHLTFLSVCLCIPLLVLGIPNLGIPALTIFYLGVGAGGVILSDFINRRIPSKSRATILSVQNQFGSITYSIAALAIGAGMDQLGVVDSAVIVGLVSMVLFFILLARNRKLVVET